jgi:hypothetical protein
MEKQNDLIKQIIDELKDDEGLSLEDLFGRIRGAGARGGQGGRSARGGRGAPKPNPPTLPPTPQPIAFRLPFLRSALICSVCNLVVFIAMSLANDNKAIVSSFKAITVSSEAI